MAEEKEQRQEQAGDLKPKRRLKWVILGALLIVLCVGILAAWFYLGKAGREEGGQSASSTLGRGSGKAQSVKVIHPLPSFIVNLMEKPTAAKRYLKLTMALEVDGDEGKIKVDKHQIQLRDTVILLLSSKGIDEIGTVDGKLGLKQEILSRVNQILGAGTVSKVYFTEFVVQ